MLVLANTELNAYEAVDDGMLKENFLALEVSGYDEEKFGLSEAGLRKWAANIYDRALEEKRDPLKDWELIIGAVLDGCRDDLEQLGAN
jgi:hypothetical protein